MPGARGFRKPSANASAMPANARPTPAHCIRCSRSPGANRCRPRAVKHGAVYRKIAMCDALVSVSPKNTQTNSPANSAPAAMPGPSVPSARNNGVPRERAQPHSSSAAITERSPAWNIGAIAALVLLMATCWKPQIAHSSSITPTARASSAPRVGDAASALIGGPRRRDAGRAANETGRRRVVGERVGDFARRAMWLNGKRRRGPAAGVCPRLVRRATMLPDRWTCRRASGGAVPVRAWAQAVG